MIKVNGEPLDHRAGMTVRDVLAARNFIFPLLIVRLDGVTVPRDHYAATPVADGTDVQVIHLMSGG